MDNVKFSKCNFIPAEINHDLSKLIKAQDLNRVNIWSQMLNNSCRDNPNLLGPEGAGGKQRRAGPLGDDDLVQQIFGKDKNYLKNINNLNNDPNASRQLQVLTLPDPPNDKNDATISTPRTATIKRIAKTSSGNYTNNIYKLFNLDDYKDLFFIIDTGDNFVTNFLRTTKPPEGVGDVNLNIIHSPETCADSACKKTGPDAHIWSQQYAQGFPKCFSWYNHISPPVNVNDNVMLTGYRIQTTPNPNETRGYIMAQTWLKYEENGYVTRAHQPDDARQENNRDTVLKKLQALNLTRPGDKEKASLAVQTKRSGDHLQIKAAIDQPDNAVQNGNKIGDDGYQLIQAPPPFVTTGPNAISLSRGKTHTKEWYKKRTFFVTIDWPALCYATYHQVNTIFVFNSTNDDSFLLSVTFPGNEPNDAPGSAEPQRV